MCKSRPSGPSQAEIDLMNAQTAQIKSQQEAIEAQNQEAEEMRARRQEEIAAEKQRDIAKQEAEREQKKRVSSTSNMFSGSSVLNPTAISGSLLRRSKGKAA